MWGGLTLNRKLATQTPSRKDLWETNDTDREEQDTQRIALFGRVALLFGNYTYIIHRYNFKALHKGKFHFPLCDDLKL